MKNQLKLLGKFRDVDNTEKWVYKTNDGIIEVTYIKNKKNTDVFCIPTHHYCTLGCKFCHLTESNKLAKGMPKITALNLQNVLNNISGQNGNKKCLLSFMGVGEPFLNIELVTDIYQTIKPQYKTVSLALATMMPSIKPIDRLIKEVENNDLPLKIHFSMHSPLDFTRNWLIPASKINIKECLENLVRYKKIADQKIKIKYNLMQFHTNPSSVEIHYTVIDGINDGDKELKTLITYGKKYGIPLKILKFNPTKSLKRSPREQHWFKTLSRDYGAPVSFYEPPGANIGSSCGQFTKHYYLGSGSKKEKKEFEEWRKKYQVFD